MANRTVRHISFDVWNTLITPNKDFAAARTEFVAKHYNVSVADAKRIYTGTKQFLDQMAEQSGMAYSTNDIYEILIKSLLEFTDRRNLINDQKTMNHEVRYIRHCVEILFVKHPPIFSDDLVEQLRRLSARAYGLSIASNSNFVSGEIMSKFLDAKFFGWKFKVFSDLEQIAKPHPKFFGEVTAKCGYKPYEILHIGDNETCDVVGAKFMGMQTEFCKSPSDVVEILSEFK